MLLEIVSSSMPAQDKFREFTVKLVATENRVCAYARPYVISQKKRGYLRAQMFRVTAYRVTWYAVPYGYQSHLDESH